MKGGDTMPRIIPIRDLKNTGEISQLCHEVDEPIFVTKNGYGDMVIMSVQAYEERLAALEVYSKLADAERQVREGKILDADHSMRNLRTKYHV